MGRKWSWSEEWISCFKSFGMLLNPQPRAEPSVQQPFLLELPLKTAQKCRKASNISLLHILTLSLRKTPSQILSGLFRSSPIPSKPSQIPLKPSQTLFQPLRGFFCKKSSNTTLFYNKNLRYGLILLDSSQGDALKAWPLLHFTIYVHNALFHLKMLKSSDFRL